MYDVWTYISIVQKLISTRFALVTSDEEAQLVLLQEVGGDIRTEVGSSTSKSIRHTATSTLWIWPEDVEYLEKKLKLVVKTC